jgi:hypothetical protein
MCETRLVVKLIFSRMDCDRPFLCSLLDFSIFWSVNTPFVQSDSVLLTVLELVLTTSRTYPFTSVHEELSSSTSVAGVTGEFALTGGFSPGWSSVRGIYESEIMTCSSVLQLLLTSSTVET